MTTPATLAIDVVIVFLFAAVAGAGYRDRETPGAIPFVVLSGLLAGLAIGVVVARATAVPRAWTPYALFTPFVFAALAWLVLAFEYTGRGPAITNRRAAALAVFGVSVIVVTALGDVVPDVILPLWVLLINVFQIALISMLGYGAVLVARSAIDYGDLPLSGSLALSAVGCGLVAITVIIALTPALPYDTAFVALEAILVTTALLLLLAQARFGIFETGAGAGHLARESVLDGMSAAVAITGRRNRVLDVNRPAVRTFDIDQPSDLGDPIESLLGFDPRETDEGPVSLGTAQGRREFECEWWNLTGGGEEPVGRAYVLRDVTDRVTREQRLDVLNRVLRHNLRNDLDAIRGFAETLEEDTETVDTVALAEQIRDTAADVADLGRTLSEAERLLDAERLDAGSVDVGSVMENVATRLGETYPDASVSVQTGTGGVALGTDRRILEIVLDETVENAIEHNDSATPSVDLVAEDRSDGIVIEVRDTGPGIPERERAVLTEGEERPLRHGSGVGLWLVYWGVTRLGGTLSFREREPRGSVVSIRLPAR